MKKNVTTIKSSSYEVRVIEYEGRALFSVNDILKACGIKWGVKWLYNARQNRSENVPMLKLKYPTMTTAGRREYEMWFADPETGETILDMVPCTDDIKKWLREEVFTYEFPGTKERPVERQAEKTAEEPLNTQTQIASGQIKPEVGNINSRIDAILFELIELKKSVLQMSV